MSAALRPPDHAIAWEEALTLSGVTSPLAFAWIPSSRAAVLGLSQKAERELDLAALDRDGIPVLRRASGGGAVLLSPGVLCFGVAVPPDWPGLDLDIHGAFRSLTAPVIEACAALGIPASQAGISDLAAPDPATGELRKIAGCAQLRKRRAILVHGSILVEADLTELTRYLPPPSEMPTYRGGRDHTTFCQNLRALHDCFLPPSRLADTIASAIRTRGWRWQDVPTSLNPYAEVLLTRKVRSQAWARDRERPSLPEPPQPSPEF